ncbi:MAG: hypothetical protein EON93_05305 [Burkholderiales bacterium]|jgi:hypothetical protein|nr:MAG: hypothetical protein EON93_05305 [Burkholderiales bacterium]
MSALIDPRSSGLEYLAAQIIRLLLDEAGADGSASVGAQLDRILANNPSAALEAQALLLTLTRLARG